MSSHMGRKVSSALPPCLPEILPATLRKIKVTTLAAFTAGSKSGQTALFYRLTPTAGSLKRITILASV